MKCILILLRILVLVCSNFAEAQPRRSSGPPVLVRVPHNKVVYTKTVKRVKVHRVIPSTALRIKHANINYHFYGGKFYRLVGRNYVIVAPPVGARVTALPFGYIRLKNAGINYYYYDGIFYHKPVGVTEYEIIEPPVGVIVPQLPKDAEKVLFEDEIYFESMGVLYRPLQKSYEVVGKIESEHY